ncbi:MAG: hypothetical protein KDA79_00925 [Planctomycetaceae bacterium]|nr:hypothetical protein [Planctomycetaceae bacterium]
MTGLAGTAERAEASGSEFSLRGHDLVLSVDSRWAGGSRGGYYPVRINVLNRGPSREFTLQLLPVSEATPRVLKTVVLEQNASTRVTLAAPMVGAGTAVELQVLYKGRRLEGLSQHLVLTDVASTLSMGPATMIVSETRRETRAIESALKGLINTGNGSAHPGWGGGYYGGAYGGYAGYLPDADVEQVPPRSLPAAWVNYTSLDLVVISLKDLATLDEGRRTALTAWLETGGNLVVWGIEQSTEGMAGLNRLLSLDRRSAMDSSWAKASLEERTPVALPEQLEEEARADVEIPAELSGVLPPQLRDAAEEALKAAQAQAQAGNQGGKWNWAAEPDAFQSRQVMQGTLFAIPGDPFTGTPHDWAWLLRTIGPSRWEWGNRHGFDARAPSDSFLAFLIPNIRGVPIYAFMVLMTLFTVLIGPVNYFVLWKRKQLYLLISTIPIFAFVTSITLFGWSTIAHGFGVKARARSLTVLDQTARTSVTTSRLALFAGVTPSSGVQFSPETAVYPIWPSADTFQQGTIDWTSTQHMPSGWLKSRTRTQLLTVRHREQRGRLDVGTAANGSLPVANGLEWPLRLLFVRTGDGRLFRGADLAAGGSLALEAVDESSLRDLRDELNEFPLKVPDYLAGHSFQNSGVWMGGYRRNWEQLQAASMLNYSSSLMEQQLTPLQQPVPKLDAIEPGSWIAVLDASPDLEYGVEEVSESASLHVVIGYYAEPGR